MKVFLAAIALTGFTCFYTVPAPAQRPSKVAVDEGGALTRILALNQYESMLLKLAGQKGRSADLRQLADNMLQEQMRMGSQLNAHANRLNLPLDTGIRSAYVKQAAQWDTRPADGTWDVDMLAEITSVHEEMISRTKKGVASVQDAASKRLLEVSLPAMERHMDQLVLLKGNLSKVGSGALDRSPDQPGTAGTNADKDQKFFSDLRLTNTYELEMMELILKKANHRGLRDAARTILQDHRKLEAELVRYAREKQYAPNDGDAAKTNEKINKWRQKPGGMEWDADVAEELVDVHKDGIDMLEDAQGDAKDEALKRLMGRALPALRTHLQILEPLKDQMKDAGDK